MWDWQTKKNNKRISHGTSIKNRQWLGGGIWHRRCVCLLLLPHQRSTPAQCHVPSTCLGIPSCERCFLRAGNLFYLSACHAAWGGDGWGLGPMSCRAQTNYSCFWIHQNSSKQFEANSQSFPERNLELEILKINNLEETRPESPWDQSNRILDILNEYGINISANIENHPESIENH